MGSIISTNSNVNENNNISLEDAMNFFDDVNYNEAFKIFENISKLDRYNSHIAYLYMSCIYCINKDYVKAYNTIILSFNNYTKNNINNALMDNLFGINVNDDKNYINDNYNFFMICFNYLGELNNKININDIHKEFNEYIEKYNMESFEKFLNNNKHYYNTDFKVDILLSIKKVIQEVNNKYKNENDYIFNINSEYNFDYKNFYENLKDDIQDMANKLNDSPHNILKQYGIFDEDKNVCKKNYFKWLKDNHPDKGGNTEICVKVMCAYKNH